MTAISIHRCFRQLMKLVPKFRWLNGSTQMNGKRQKVEKRRLGRRTAFFEMP